MGQQMRIVILSGFVGSGKTTLLLRLAAYLKTLTVGEAKRLARVAIIENEIGSVGIDTKALGASGLEVREMLSGCVCCSLQENLAFTIAELATTIAPDWLLIEATGLASGSQVAEGIRTSASIQTQITSLVLVDAQRLEGLLAKAEMMVRRQLVGADVLLLNKVDLLTDDQLETVRRTLRGLQPEARIIELSAASGIAVEQWREILDGGSIAG